jgi:hypothetical protein
VIIGETPEARLAATVHRGEAIRATTTFELAGYRTVKSLGVVRGITVRTRSLPLTMIGGIRTLFGGRAGIFTNLCEKTREESFELMLAHAKDSAPMRWWACATTLARWSERPRFCATERRDRRADVSSSAVTVGQYRHFMA